MVTAVETSPNSWFTASIMFFLKNTGVTSVVDVLTNSLKELGKLGYVKTV